MDGLPKTKQRYNNLKEKNMKSTLEQYLSADTDEDRKRIVDEHAWFSLLLCGEKLETFESNWLIIGSKNNWGRNLMGFHAIDTRLYDLSLPRLNLNNQTHKLFPKDINKITRKKGTYNFSVHLNEANIIRVLVGRETYKSYRDISILNQRNILEEGLNLLFAQNKLPKI